MFSHDQNLSSGTPIEPGLCFWSPELNTDWGMCCSCCCCSVAKLCLTLQPPGLSTPGLPVIQHLQEIAQVHVNWITDAIQLSSSVTLFSFCLKSPSISGSFPVSQLFTPGGQSIGASDAASVLPMSVQDWFPLGLISLISLLSTGLSRVFTSTTIWKHQFFGALPSLWSNPHICTWWPRRL